MNNMNMNNTIINIKRGFLVSFIHNKGVLSTLHVKNLALNPTACSNENSPIDSNAGGKLTLL